MPIQQLHRKGSRVYGEIRQKVEERWKKFSFKDLPWRKIGLSVAVAAAVFVIVGTGLVLWASRDLPDPNNLNNRQVAQSTKIYDRTGQHLLYEVYADQKRTIVDLDQISPWVPKATIAVEDKDFYQHKGIRVASILRAGFSDVLNGALRLIGIHRRTGSGGASTLTQQLIKNTIVGNSQSFVRKIKEAVLAIQIERKYSKDEILKLYLNEIPYGSTNFGVEAASQSYFHKSAKDLTLAEAATLAALPKQPSYYLAHLDALKDRRNLVLKLMFDQGYITEDQKNEAQQEDLKLERDPGLLDAPHFVLYVKQLLADQFGEQVVDTGGLKVITSLDYDKQKLAEKIVQENGDKFAKQANANNAALIAIDPKTGQILAMVGSRDFNNKDIDGQFNVVTLGKLQPGSSLKPFVYTAAFEKGYTPDTVLYDVRTDFDLRSGAKYTPKNYDGKDHGLVTMRKALQGSLNIPAVKTLYLVGITNMINFAQRFGYTTLNGDDCQLTLVLGGCLVNPLEHADAYATLADNGVYHAPVSILQVMSSTGDTLYQWQPSEGQEAVSPDLAATITNVLTDNNARAFIFGLHNSLVLPDRPVAAKTGTTNDSKDAWTMGYTPSLTVGVWVGNTPKPMPMKGGGNALAGAIWNQFMSQALQGTPVEQFSIPPANTSTKPVLRGADDGIQLPIDTLTGKIATSSTPENLIVEKTFLPPHDILYYVQKDDPQGPPPTNPADDPQYENWEQGLQSWVAREQAAGTPVTLEDPPTEYDSPQSLELMPTLNVISPTPNQIITDRNLNFQVTASAPRGVQQVVYMLDGTIVGTVTQYPFNLTYYAQKTPRGVHDLKVLAQDDLGDTAEKDVSFDLEADLDPPSFDWFDQSPLTLSEEDFPRSIALNPFRWDATTNIQIYLKSPTDEKLIYTFTPANDNLFNNQLLFTWQHSPGVGDYTLRGVLTDNQGRTVEKDLEVVIK